jgi:hypothetical protein
MYGMGSILKDRNLEAVRTRGPGEVAPIRYLAIKNDFLGLPNGFP